MTRIEKIVDGLSQFGITVEAAELREKVRMLVEVALSVAPDLEHNSRLILYTWVKSQLTMEAQGHFIGLLSGMQELIKIQKGFEAAR